MLLPLGLIWIWLFEGRIWICRKLNGSANIALNRYVLHIASYVLKQAFSCRSQNTKDSFRQLVEKTIQQLEGAFACVFKSTIFPGECVATRRGSPLLVG
jgi:hypothetical protein